jgi:hypothetical protein
MIYYRSLLSIVFVKSRFRGLRRRRRRNVSAFFGSITIILFVLIP